MNKTQNDTRRSANMSMAAAGVVGAVVGAAAGIALSNKQTREKIREVVDDVKAKSGELKDTLAQEAQSLRDQAAEIGSQTQQPMEERDIHSRTTRGRKPAGRTASK